MKKRIFSAVVISSILLLTALTPAMGASSKNKCSADICKAEKEIRNVLNKQVELSDKRDLAGLRAFYSTDYRNSDAFDRDTTFALVKENFEIYPDLKISLKINNIDVQGKYAVANVTEYASKDDLKRDDIDYKGKLRAEAKTLYYLENINGKWLITSEHSLYEKNMITFGEAEYAGIELEIPMSVPAGKEYDAVLKINNLPQTAVVMGSITKSDAVYPIPEEDDTNDPYRIFEDTALERILIANRDNINEYVSGTIGITRSKPLPNGDYKLYLSGLAFVMGKVNVIPENTKYTPAKIVDEISEQQVENSENASVDPEDILPNDDYIKESESVDD